MRVSEEHPHLLLWYVSGAIGAREREEIDLHLETCEGCRAEAASLASMMRSVQIQSRVDHVAAAELVLYEEELLSVRDERRAVIETHLAECPGCREDLETLRRARRRERAWVGGVEGPRRSALARRRGWILAATAAGVVLGVVVASSTLLLRPPLNALRTGAHAVVFPAPRRGPEAGRRLKGAGPWTIRVLLPFGAKEGAYRVDVRRADGSRTPVMRGTARTDQDLGLVVNVPALPGPGRYEMTLSRYMEGPEEIYRYPFDLLPSPGGAPHR